MRRENSFVGMRAVWSVTHGSASQYRSLCSNHSTVAITLPVVAIGPPASACSADRPACFQLL